MSKSAFPQTTGKTLLNGTTAPGDGIGNNGDFYINTVAGVIYGPKANGTWPSGSSLIGPQGPEGDVSTTPGPQGPQGIPGAGNLTYEGSWVTVTLYHINDILKGADSLFYRCTTQHTSGETTEPGVGASWADDWELFGGGGGGGGDFLVMQVFS